MRQKRTRAVQRNNYKSVKRPMVFLLQSCSIILLFCCAIALPVYGSQGGEMLNQIRDPQTGLQNPLAMTLDSTGNVIVTGYSDQSGTDDYYTVKFNASLTSVLWRTPYNGSSSQTDRAVAIVVDSSDNVIVTGYARNASNTNYDIYTMKYNASDGLPATGWSTPQIFNGAANGNDYATSIAIDSSNNVYVGGYSQGSNGKDDFVIISYKTDGTINTTFGGTAIVTYNATVNGDDRLVSIAAGSTGVAVTGYSESTRTEKDFDCMTIKYNLSGTLLWQYRHDMAGDNRGKIVRMDPSGNVIMAGYIFNNVSKDRDIHVTKFNTTGTVLWEQDHGGGYSDDEPAALFVDASYIYMAGFSFSINTSNDIYIAKYKNDDAGTIQWSAVLNTTGGNDEIPTGIAVNSSTGEVFVTGYTIDAVTHNYDWLTAKYTATGELLWYKSFNGAANKNDRTVGISILSLTGEVYVAGWSDVWTGGASDYDYYVIKYDSGTLNKPTQLTATAIGATRVDLVWADNSTNEDGFKIDRCEGTGCNFSTVTTFSAGQDATSYSDTSVIADKVYRYRAYSYKGAENSYYSDVSEAITSALDPLSPSWLYRYDGGGPDEVASLAVGAGNAPVSDQNPVVAGYSFINGGTYDYYVIKLDRTDPSPSKVKWQSRWDDTYQGEDTAGAMAVDSTNNVSVSGFGPGPGNDDDIYTMKFQGSDGSTLWDVASRFGNSDYDYAVTATADSSNNIFIAGYGKNNKSGRNDEDIYIVKYLSDGTQVWAATYDGGFGNDRPTGIVADSSGNICITGYTKTSANYDYFTAKYNGSTGAMMWGGAPKTYNGPGNGDDYANSIAIGRTGSIYVTGTSVNANSKKDFYTIKYNSSTGAELWAKAYGGSATTDYEAASIKVDPIDDQRDDGIVVAGTTMTDAGNHDFYVIRYDDEGGICNSGNPKCSCNTDTNSSCNWPKVILRPGIDDNVKAMDIDPSGNVCIAGDSGTDPGLDILAVKLPYTGAIKSGWATIFDGAAHGTDETKAVASNDYGEMFVAGSSMNTTNYDYAVFMCRGDSVVVPSPFTHATVAGSGPGNQQINLTWLNPILSGATYTLKRIDNTCSSPPCSWTAVTLTPDTRTDYPDTGLKADNKYCYQVYATKGAIDSRVLGKCKITRRVPPTTLKPLTVVSTSQIIVSWDPVPDTSVSQVLGYMLERNTGATCSGGTWTQVGGDFDANTYAYSDTGLSAGTKYCYRLSVRNDIIITGDTYRGYSQPGATVSDTTVPPAPSLSTPSARTTSTITFSWGATSGTTSYTVQYKCTESAGPSCSPISYTNVTTPNCVGIAGTSCTPSGLTSGTHYYFRVNASNAAGTSVWSNEVSDWTQPTQTSISVTRTSPVTCSTSGDSSSTATITWDNVSDETAYYVQYAYCSLSNDNVNNCNTTSSYWYGWYDVGRPGLNVTSTTLSMTPGYAYKFKVASTVNSGNRLSDWSVQDITTTGSVWACMATLTQSAVTAETRSVPPPPANLRVNWTNIAGNRYFDVQRQTCAGACSGDTCASGGGYSTVITNLGYNDSSWLDTTVASNTSYSYKVVARNATAFGAEGPNSPGADVTSNEKCLQVPPPAPNTVTLTGVTNNSITVNWQDQGGGTYTGYLIDRYTNSSDNPADNTAGNWGSHTQFTISNPATLTYTDNSPALSPGYGYKYFIRASYGSGTYTAFTDEKFTRTIPPTLNFASLSPDSTTRITAYWYDVTGNTRFTLGWKARNGSDCTGDPYTYYDYNSTSCPWNGSQYICSYNAPTLSEGLTYCYIIRASNSSGDSEYSSPATRMTLLSPPSNLILTVNSSTQITLNWLTVAGNKGFKIERSTDGTNFSQIAITGDSETEYVDNTGLTAGTLYYYRISTKNGEGNYSVASAVKSKTTTPATPTSVSLNVISESRIDISWQVTKGATQYLVEGTIGVGGAMETVANLSIAYVELYCGYYSVPTVYCTTLIPKYTSTTSTALEENKEYCYKVTAWNADGGYSAPGSMICAKTRSMNAPVLISVTAPKSREIDLLWSYSPIGDSPDGFEIEAKAGTDNWISKDIVASPAATAYSDKGGIQPGTLYTYRVRAYKEIFTDGFSVISPLIWGKTTSVPNGYGSASVTSTGGAVRFAATSTTAGTAGTYNQSFLYLVDPEILSGDFDVQVDYNLTNPTTSSLWNTYIGLTVIFPASDGGNNNQIMAERSINYYNGAWRNVYQGSVWVNGVRDDGFYETSDISGKLRITRSGSVVSAYAFINGLWYLLNSDKGVTLQSTPSFVRLIQKAQQTGNITLTADIDNFKVTSKSAYSNEKSATTPAWQSSDEQCQ